MSETMLEGGGLSRTQRVCACTCVQGCVKGEWVSVSWVLDVAVCMMSGCRVHVCSWLTLPFPHQMCVLGEGFQGGNRSLLQQPLTQLAFLAIFPRKPAMAKLLLPTVFLRLRGREQAKPRERGGG